MNYKEIAANLLKQDAKVQQQIQRRVEAAHAEIEALLEKFLLIDPALQEVILFGSLAKKKVRHLNFDIDLAVRCSSNRYLRLVSAGLDSDFKVDVVDLERVNQGLRQFILKDGIVLYEKR